MAEVLIGMGSNIEPEKHLLAAATALRIQFGSVAFSSVYRSAAVGMQGSDFLNACCRLQSEMPAGEIKLCLKGLEDAQGRDRSEGSWRPRTLDLDVLMYGGEVLDDELYRYAHAFVPAAELVEIDLPCDDEKTVTLVELRL
ncbi:2-amino-4-hydroxy-6-hydroxymethyldihydropteridine diphosphokinase [Mariprofundus ferrinatatus]|uniref:2-amino-4-hydroxy-6-hydroxymethyldihydropteridine pyrophosphokinase n=1 Tax=Mariprofundus ferrinatatus TaxID=1921087 RepID=A0A2K8L6C0_9PROT|nr:2-amino-4-hydroxy-6-hydroxymethyldihydropteridine diphosphokinase [Mariprofundus ferrinatatus]ATX82783.1 2-amino-4-hydroxy-6-hydroxymethyldihydropteridine diphosphokinase [Mariprofundus ferrinatatus]